jgi:hypothetical protein
MNPWRWVDPRVSSVRVADVRAYLLGRGWKVRLSKDPRTLVFEEPSLDGGPPFVQYFPASEDFSDYTRDVTELITTLSEIDNRHPVQVLEDILGARGKAAEGKSKRNGERAAASSRPAEKPRRRNK